MSSSHIRRVQGRTSTVSSMSDMSEGSPASSTIPQIASLPRNFAGSSSSSGASGMSGPSNKEPAFITSQWGVGWQTPTLMLSSYLLALAVSIAHFVFFDFLDGKEADWPHQVVPQAYVTTISNILANIFGYSLRGSLSIAFVQYLWLLLRIQTMKVSTIELLFSIRTNLFVLLRPAALKATPVLFALAIVVWASQVVVSFPPGAITVTSRQRISFDNVTVPTFNGSFMGNASGVEANAYSLNTLSLSAPNGFSTIGLDGQKNGNLIPRIASQVLITGEALPMASPCGVNCSYLVQFEGPYFNCNNTSAKLYYDSGKNVSMYNGSWFDPRMSSSSAFGFHSGPGQTGPLTIARFNSSTFTPLSANANAFIARSDNRSANGWVFMQQDTLFCVPGRANFTVKHTYINNIQTRTVSIDPSEPLINLAPPTHNSEIVVPGFCLNGTHAYGTMPANWSSFARSYFRDNNIMVIFDALMSALDGSFVADLHNPPSLDFLAPINTSSTFNDLVWDAFVQTTLTGRSISQSPQGGTIIESTRLNEAFGKFSAFDAVHPHFNLTQDIINDYLFNMTTSIMVAFGTWKTGANATVSTTINVYSFSQPLTLFLPYFISLGLALPFIILGGIALRTNGVSAMDSSFTQIITTSTGSAVLDKAAAGGCLGGNESLPQELKDMKIRFGEFIGRDDPGRIRRAGFGVESEVIPLKKGANYGIARWI